MRTDRPARLIVPVSQQDHLKGLSGAPVVLVEYGDYQCPYCGQAYWLVKNLEQRLGGLLGFVFRNFPLANVHSHAEMAAESAEAAATQEKFWAMHDCLFEQQQALETRDLVAYAAAGSIYRGPFATWPDAVTPSVCAETDVLLAWSKT